MTRTRLDLDLADFAESDAHDPWSEEIVRCGQCGGFFAEDEGHPAAGGLVCGPCWESGVAA